MYPNSLSSFTILQLFLLVVNVSGSTFYDDRRELPEYSEYLRRLGLKTTTVTPTSTIVGKKYLALAQPLNQFPTIQLCKEKPEEGDIYGQIFCWGMLFLYILLVISLVVYQFRSLIWLKSTTKQQSVKRQKTVSKEDKPEEYQFATYSYGHNSNSKNSDGKSADEEGFSRLLSV